MISHYDRHRLSQRPKQIAQGSGCSTGGTGDARKIQQLSVAVFHEGHRKFRMISKLFASKKTYAVQATQDGPSFAPLRL